MITTLRYIRKQTIFFFLCILPTNSPIQLPLCCKRFTHSSKTRIAKIHAVRQICFFHTLQKWSLCNGLKNFYPKQMTQQRTQRTDSNEFIGFSRCNVDLNRYCLRARKDFKNLGLGCGSRLLLWFTDQHQLPIPGYRGLQPCPVVSPASRAAAPCDG